MFKIKLQKIKFGLLGKSVLFRLVHHDEKDMDTKKEKKNESQYKEKEKKKKKTTQMNIECKLKFLHLAQSEFVFIFYLLEPFSSSFKFVQHCTVKSHAQSSNRSPALTSHWADPQSEEGVKG